MSPPPLSPLESFPEPSADMEIVEPLCAVFRRKLKDEGLKYTPERARILDAIVRMDDVFEADQLIAAVRSGSGRVSKATVYRTIHLLQESGIIQRIPLAEDQAHYQMVYGRRPNDLLIRLDVDDAGEHAGGPGRGPNARRGGGRIETLDIPELIELRDRICRERGLEARGHRFLVFAVARK
jgi:Fur family transcriptional regulator, ferric uptake regulator